MHVGYLMSVMLVIAFGPFGVLGLGFVSLLWFQLGVAAFDLCYSIWF